MFCVAEQRASFKLHLFLSLPLCAIVYLPLCVSDETVLQTLHMIFPDIKFQTQFPLPQWSVCCYKSGAAAVCMWLYSLLIFRTSGQKHS